jgi:TetR/AcrR family transcriptional regulator, transcriptional repressor for nem operon
VIIVSEVRAHFSTLSTWLASLLETGAEQGSIRVASSPQIEAELLMATVHGAMLSARAYGKPGMFGTVVAPLLERVTAQSSA